MMMSSLGFSSATIQKKYAKINSGNSISIQKDKKHRFIAIVSAFFDPEKHG